MSINELPLEILEEIFQYLSVEDMVNAWEAVSLNGRESYWGKLCRRKGYNKFGIVDDTWRSVVRRNVNWRHRRFVKRFEVPKLGVFNISNEPNLVEIMQDVEDFEICGSKLMVYNDTSFRIYTLQQGQYCEIFHSEHKTFKKSVISNEFFAFINSTSGNVGIVDLLKLDEFNWIQPQDREITSLSICGTVLNIGYVTRLERNYYFGRYNLEERASINNVLLFERSVLPEPLFAFSSLLVVYQIVDYYVFSNLYVRKVDGQLVNNFRGCDLVAVDGEHVVYIDRYNKLDRILYIMTSKNPSGYPKEVFLERSLNQSYPILYYTVSLFGSILILTRIVCFTVIDIQNATCLYEVDCKSHYLPYTNFSSVCVNECFYVLYYTKEDEEQDSSSSGASPISESSDSTSDNMLLVVYDFR